MLARAFLRLCALEALRPSSLLAAHGPWPTLAGQYVSDSRIDPVDDNIGSDERRQLIGVFTETGSLTKIAQAGPQFYAGEVDLVFELSTVARYTNGEGAPIIDYADTDAATEAQIDVLEDEVFHALHFGPTGKLFRQMAKLPVMEWQSVPHRSGTEDIRLAKRTVRARLRMKEVCYAAAPATAPVGLDRLPPALRDIATQLGGSSYLADLALGLALAAPVMPVAVPFEIGALQLQPVAGVPPIGANVPIPQGGT